MNPEETPNEQSDRLSQIRTYQGDIAEALHNQNESIVSIQRAEVARKAETVMPAIEVPKKKVDTKAILLFIGSIVLLAGAAVAGWYSYNLYRKKTRLPTVTFAENRFVAPESTINVDTATLNRDSLIELISNEIGKATTGDSGKIEQFQFEASAASSSLITTSAFFKLLQTQALGSLVRSFDPLFMYGIYTGENPSAFIIIKLASFERAFPGMLSWEESMVQDIGPLFATKDMVQNIAPGTSFIDTTIKNNDARILLDQSGKTVLLYSFYNREMLIITDSTSTLSRLEVGLQNQQLSR